MSAPATERAEAATERTSAAGDPADRGSLDIDRAVLRKIAEHAADCVSGTTRAPRRIVGVGVGTQGSSARLTGPDRELRVRLDLALRYPAPVRDAVREVRERVREELSRQAGCRVTAVEVTVSALVPAPKRDRVE
ncbi:Asp23/Gls24 family envelope stress response protein [Saccharopolyspora sp. 6V]|uniref:Asp23/Gls24 family envelope stress response protein n=1 Tax=Saccharopolyspora sp. 6V TaxID=2877239 RepID=UPI001CD5A3BE|nr:Asp23/Gls24 family envelope stress response protein [Saccharopolyspora sp. 6V]MCA1193106.1 Asp23/Gls24 family envelope stress response protein [Saccharopolyspora sp. 6V]